MRAGAAGFAGRGVSDPLRELGRIALERIARGECVHCGQKIESRRTEGRCVYAMPCGHRQGTAAEDSQPSEPCVHLDFAAEVEVNRFEDTGRFNVEVRVRCRACDEPFRFLGLPSGLLTERPATSVDGLELRAPIEPQGVPRLAARSVFEVPKVPEKA